MPKYLLTNEVIATELWKLLETNPSYSEDLTTKAKVGKSAVCTYFKFRPGVLVDTAGDFPDISLAKSGWRTEGTLNGTFVAGTWTFKVRLENDTKYAFSVKVAVRLSKSAYADGHNATLIGVYESPNVLNLPASAGGSVSDTWTANLNAITLMNEYLFAEYRIHIEVAGGSTSCQCSFACDENPSIADESITTTTFIPTETIVAKDFPMLYYATTPEELRSKVIGMPINHIANDYPEALLKFGKANELRSKWGYLRKLTGLQLREHKREVAYDPDYTFSKSTATGYTNWLEMFSSNASIGGGYFFAVFKRNWLHGKRVKVYLYATGSWTANNNHVAIYDGSYDRKSDTDFPSGSGIPLKGAGILKDIAFSTTAGNITIDTGILDLSAGQLDTCTLFIINYDSWSAQNLTLRLQKIEIWDDSNLLMSYSTIPDSITMERTGTTGDYGYIGTINEPIGGIY